MPIDVWYVCLSAINALHLSQRVCLAERMLVHMRVCCHSHAARTCQARQAWICQLRLLDLKSVLRFNVLPENASSLLRTLLQLRLKIGQSAGKQRL